MTPELDQGERLRAALARTVDAHTPSAAPVDRILAAGRARRSRRRAVVVAASAAAVLAAGLTALPLSGHDRVRPADRPGRPVTHPSDRATPRSGPVTAVVGHGTVDGTPWSVTLEYRPTLPKGFSAPSPPPGITEPPGRTSLLCQRMVIAGTRVDHQGGLWSDCQQVRGAHDPAEPGEAGLWGLYDKGSSGVRLVVGSPDTAVTHAAVTLTGGQRLTASTVTVPGTGYRAWAVAVPGGRTIASVDEFDARDHRVSHDTNFH